MFILASALLFSIVVYANFDGSGAVPGMTRA